MFGAKNVGGGGENLLECSSYSNENIYVSTIYVVYRYLHLCNLLYIMVVIVDFVLLFLFF